MRTRRTLAVLAASAVTAPAALATIVSTNASNNATIRTTGPRTGTSGKTGFNVEGYLNGGSTQQYRS
jgi:subtilase family serine protease